MQFIAIAMIVLGVIVLALGPRLVILGAAVGALLGLVILRFIPGTQDSFLAFLIPLVLAVVFAFGGGFMRGIVGLVTIAIGAVAGAAIVLGILELFNFSLGTLLDLVLAAIGAVIGIILIQRFKDWAIYIVAGVVGALLCVRGLQILVPSFTGIFASLLGLALAAGGFVYQSGIVGGRRQEVK
ncbi:MAG: hypothetical protein EYC68_18305 [Chloroflexota bacterium]|nr:MAG: hypothetical protein EYC68_18305 [Chloroflexota bacterium]